MFGFLSTLHFIHSIKPTENRQILIPESYLLLLHFGLLVGLMESQTQNMSQFRHSSAPFSLFRVFRLFILYIKILEPFHSLLLLLRGYVYLNFPDLF